MTDTNEPGVKPRRTRLLVVLVIIMVLIPGYGLVTRWAHDGSQPHSEALFSFQMYSLTTTPRYEGVTAAGAKRAISADSLPLVARHNNYDASVPKLLCEKYPDLVSVKRVKGPFLGTFTC